MTTAVDVINAKDGTYNGAATYHAGLIPGDAAADFNGVSPNGVDLPTDTFPTSTSTQMSFVFFASHPAAASPNGFQGILFNDDRLVIGVLDNTSPFNGHVFADVVGSPTFRVEGSTNVGVPWDDSVHMIGLTRNGTSWKIYLDGALDGSQTGTASFNANPATYRLSGAQNWVMDECATFTSELSSTDMSNIWAARTGYSGLNSAILALSPYNYWHLDELPPPTPAEPGWYVGQVGMFG